MRRAFLFVALFLLVVGIGAGAWLWTGWQSLHRPVKEAGEPIVISILPGGSARAIIGQLAAAGALPASPFPELFYRFILDNPPLQAGEYSLPATSTPVEVFRKIISGDVVTRPLVIIEGLTVAEIVLEIDKQGFASAEELWAAATPRLIHDLDPLAQDLEGYLFPDTYHFPRTATAQDILTTMISTFRERSEDLRRKPDALPLRELVTLASIVEKETQNDFERQLVAGVYRNRLDRRMGLYADPTIIYALKKSGTWDGNLRKSDLQMDSPYNTYKVQGLPPGPICSPGRASLEAAADPSTEPYLYFVSRNDGTHVFARTLREHNRNVNTWQREYWRKKWKQQPANEDSSPP